MKKITTAIFMLTVTGSMLFAQNGSKNAVPTPRTVLGNEEVHTDKNLNTSATSGKEVTIFSEDFASGIPSTWVNAGYDAFGNVLTNAKWVYRGTSTTPNNTIGSQGAYSGAQAPIASPTTANGFVIFDSDFLDNAGIAGNFGNGIAPAPHLGTLTTPMIDLTGNSFVELKFNSYHRYFEGRAIIAFSTDNGATWPDTLAAHPGIAVNAATATNAVVGLNISNIVGDMDSVKLRFIFDGTYDDPGASGSGAGYYFWMIDDIEINGLPKHELRLTDWNGAPSFDMIFGPASGSSKMGIVAKNNNTDQTRDMEFDANAYNYGWGTLNNVKLQVSILDVNNTLISTYTSTGSVNLMSGDTANYNTLNTYNNAFNPNAVGTYRALYKVYSDSATVYSDTINFYVTDSLMSSDMNDFDNRIGTANVGDDGSALATRMDLVDDVIMTGVWVGLSNTTVAGGTIEVEVYDTVGFDFIAGFPSANLKAASASYIITQGDIDNGYFQVPVSDGVNNFVMLSGPSYYVSVKMFSNAGANVIYLRNGQTLSQPATAKLMYYTLDPNATPRWYTGFTSDVINSLWIRPIVSTGIGVAEDALKAAINVGPNPASDYVNVMFNDIEGDFTLTMTDVTGRVVSSETVNVLGAVNHTVNVSSLSAGVYMLNVNSGAASVTYKISVQ